MKWLYFVLPGVIYFGCSPKTENAKTLGQDSIKAMTASGFDENNFESYINLENYIVADADTSNVQEINASCAVIVNPTGDQMQSMEKEYGDDFATMADDYSFYQSEAIIKFDSAKVKVVNAEKRFVKLIGKSGSWTLDLRKDGAPEWNIILFNIDKKPQVSSAIDITYEKVGEYFY
jgi:hypothetical protein